MFIIGGIFLLLIASVVCGCLVHSNDYDKEIEDMEQMEYLKKWNEEHSM